ncbi:MAG: hypothetical protein IJX25_00295 [Clostridia bacterium]|nr:hypothetical protein [Clostridia bacterium]
MALHNLKIVVVDGGRSGSYCSKDREDSKSNKKNYKDTPLYKALNAKETIKNKVQEGMSPAAVFAMNMGLRVASQVVKQTANYYISDIGRTNGDSNYQAAVNRQIEIASDSLSVAGGIASGASAGSMFGWVGAIIGAVVGGASSGISLGFKYMERNREYQHEMFKQNTSQAYSLARANYSAFTGRVR